MRGHELALSREGLAARAELVKVTRALALLR
jgi:hypothetical protein